MVRIRREFFTSLIVGSLLVALSSQAAEPQQPSKQQTSEEDLVKQTQNPVADLVSVFRFQEGAAILTPET